MTATLNASELAHIAGCHAPAAPDSPGALWLEDVARHVGEVRSAITAGAYADAAINAEIDALGYSPEKCWPIFADLKAWDEDLLNWEPFDDFTAEAAGALYTIAYRLLEALLPPLTLRRERTAS